MRIKYWLALCVIGFVAMFVMTDMVTSEMNPEGAPPHHDSNQGDDTATEQSTDTDQDEQCMAMGYTKTAGINVPRPPSLDCTTCTFQSLVKKWLHMAKKKSPIEIKIKAAGESITGGPIDVPWTTILVGAIVGVLLWENKTTILSWVPRVTYTKGKPTGPPSYSRY
jgi:hypothetical protein